MESFYGKLRDELMNAEVFDTLAEARVLIEQWRVHYNKVRPHSSLGYRQAAGNKRTLPKTLAALVRDPDRNVRRAFDGNNLSSPTPESFFDRRHWLGQ